ncbi:MULTISPECIES: hypothetical protein [unclassified Crossiella]|uniref:hypothetical protein n=1 Tax=unclassified Crossiella TaxID=2620835 RepID=UPI001FFF97ED|nr:MULTISPECIES: hypothetical protein [unclassified Crossiella]MCK2240047.1 hypothetical protein [Crossiella sp. S99.2]MCK2252755.1 hypothetical protein [Crossiella sp. S99.1]
MSTTNTQPRERWVHTGIDAPYSFSMPDLSHTPTSRGLAYSGTLVHPEFGAVGLIVNEGRGLPTAFHPHDRARFGVAHLEAFLRQCQQDGEPMATDTNIEGVADLLEAIVDEAETASHVTRMRATNSFLLRSYLPREAGDWGPERGAVLAWTRILLTHTSRERLAAKLDEHEAGGLETGAYWQMFDGQDWTRLLGPSPLTPEQANTRIRRAEQLAAGLPDGNASLHAAPFSGDLWLFGKPARRFTLVGDTSYLLNTDSWCRCPNRQPIVQFELWNSTGLEGSGTVHAAQLCRRLVRIN